MPHKLVIYILVLGLAIRIFYVLAYPQLEITTDAAQYDALAHHLLQHGEFPEGQKEKEIYRPPLYYMFLASIYSLFNNKYAIVRVIQALINISTIYLIVLLAHMLFKSFKINICVALILCLHSGLISYCGILYTEILFTFFLVLVIFFILKAFYSPHFLRYSIGAGFFLGCAALTSSRVIFFPLFLLVFSLLLFNKTVLSQKICTIIFVFMILTILPWTVRNYKVTGKFILLESFTRASIWFATNPYDIFNWGYGPEYEPLRKLTRGRTLTERWDLMQKEGIENLKKYPFIYVKLCFKRFFRLWVSGYSNHYYNLQDTTLEAWKSKNYKLLITKLLFILINVGLVLLGFLGMLKIFRLKDVRIYIVFAPILYFTLLHTFTVSSPRLALPIIPFLMIFAAFYFCNVLLNKLPRAGIKQQ